MYIYFQTGMLEVTSLDRFCIPLQSRHLLLQALVLLNQNLNLGEKQNVKTLAIRTILTLGVVFQSRYFITELLLAGGLEFIR